MATRLIEVKTWLNIDRNCTIDSDTTDLEDVYLKEPGFGSGFAPRTVVARLLFPNDRLVNDRWCRECESYTNHTTNEHREVAADLPTEY